MVHASHVAEVPFVADNTCTDFHIADIHSSLDSRTVQVAYKVAGNMSVHLRNVSTERHMVADI